ncbi:MAG: hypothetical protein HZA90_16860 [Verrucomicrobia bacterium]|nr:hypothetical protein [Verrucomicrobiota bacterium]
MMWADATPLLARAARRTCAALLAGALCAAALSAATPPLRWRWSNPRPHGGNIVDMAFSPGLLLAVQVAERGQIYTSSDLDLWLPRESGTTDALRAVTFFGARILITGENGRVLYADDVDDFRPGTLVDGPVTNWLEAVTASATLAVAVGTRGAVFTSANGMNWRRQSNTITADLRGVAFGGGTFVTVGTSGFIATSTNGATWTPRASGTSQHLNRVTFANGRFTAVGNAGVTRSSNNGGATWGAEATGATGDLEYATTGGAALLVAGSNEVRLQDGGAWSNELAKANGPPSWTYYSALGLPGFFLIAGQTGLMSEGYKTNSAPFFWLTPNASVRQWLFDAAWASNLYVTVGDYGTVMTSGNGVDWTLELVPTSATNTVFFGVGGTTNLLLAVGDSGTMIYSPNLLATNYVTNLSGVVTQTISSLGVRWFPMPARATTNDLQGVGVLSNKLYVVTGDRGTLLTSTNGTNWASWRAPTNTLLSSVAEWPGGLVVTGDDGTILTSPNGSNWTVQASGTTNWLYRVRYLNGTLLTVGQDGTILTSTNGVDWTHRPSGTTRWLTDAAFLTNTWFITGYSGTVLTSTDLLNWTNQGTLTRKHLFSAATDARQLVTVGVEGVILRSQVVPDLTPVTFLNFDHLASANGVTNVNIYLFGGQPDQRFTLDRSPDVASTNWVSGASLEFFDGSGTLYYVETFLSTNLPKQEFYVAPLRQ